MRSIPEQSTPARIRDAAIRVFAHTGYTATVRAIAAEADVAPGLVIHHFESKEQLRDACDAHVTALLLDDKTHGDATIASIATHFAGENSPPLIDYVRRMLNSDAPAAAALFDRLVDATRRMLHDQQAAGLLREAVDVDALAPMLTLYGLAPVAMPALLARATGRETVDAAALETASAAMLPLLSGGLYREVEQAQG